MFYTVHSFIALVRAILCSTLFNHATLALCCFNACCLLTTLFSRDFLFSHIIFGFASPHPATMAFFFQADDPQLFSLLYITTTTTPASNTTFHICLRFQGHSYQWQGESSRSEAKRRGGAVIALVLWEQDHLLRRITREGAKRIGVGRDKARGDLKRLKQRNLTKQTLFCFPKYLCFVFCFSVRVFACQCPCTFSLLHISFYFTFQSAWLFLLVSFGYVLPTWSSRHGSCLMRRV